MHFLCTLKDIKIKKYINMKRALLGTDMKHHFSDIAKAKARLTAQDFNIKDKNDKLLCMNSVVHAADISNPIKEWRISFGWT